MITPKKAVALSLANMMSEGLDDVLSEPFEISLLRKVIASAGQFEERC